MAWSLRPGQQFWPRRRRTVGAPPAVPVAPVPVASPVPADGYPVLPGLPLLTVAPASAMVTIPPPGTATPGPSLPPTTAAHQVRPFAGPAAVTDPTPIRYDTAATRRPPTGPVGWTPSAPTGWTPSAPVRAAAAGSGDVRPVGPVAYQTPPTGNDASWFPRSGGHVSGVPQPAAGPANGMPSPADPTWWGGLAPGAVREPDRPLQAVPRAPDPTASRAPTDLHGPTAMPDPAPNHALTPGNGSALDHGLIPGHGPALDHGLASDHGPALGHGSAVVPRAVPGPAGDSGPVPGAGPNVAGGPAVDQGPAVQRGPGGAVGRPGGAAAFPASGPPGGPENPQGRTSAWRSDGAGADAAAARTAAQFAAAGLPTAQVWPPPGFEVAYLAAEATRAAEESRASAGGGRARPAQPDTGLRAATAGPGHDGRSDPEGLRRRPVRCARSRWPSPDVGAAPPARGPPDRVRSRRPLRNRDQSTRVARPPRPPLP